jgi:hypothetical protein
MAVVLLTMTKLLVPSETGASRMDRLRLRLRKTRYLNLNLDLDLGVRPLTGS